MSSGDRAGKKPVDAGSPSSAGKPSILVVDDDAAIRVLLREILIGAGYRVSLAADGNEAIDFVRQQAVDLVITDLFMPEREGMETIQDLLTLRPGLPIIAMSGEGRDLLPVARLLGARATVAKPFRSEELLETVASLLRSKR
jgi:CheY-like chemotaxis protein